MNEPYFGFIVVSQQPSRWHRQPSYSAEPDPCEKVARVVCDNTASQATDSGPIQRSTVTLPPSPLLRSPQNSIIIVAHRIRHRAEGAVLLPPAITRHKSLGDLSDAKPSQLHSHSYHAAWSTSKPIESLHCAFSDRSQPRQRQSSGLCIITAGRPTRPKRSILGTHLVAAAQSGIFVSRFADITDAYAPVVNIVLAAKTGCGRVPAVGSSTS